MSVWILRIGGAVMAMAAFLPVVWAQGSYHQAAADVTVGAGAVLVLPANPARYAASCTNTSSTVHVRWGDSAVTASRGQQIRAGTAIEIRSRGNIYMIAESGSAIVSCTEEYK